MIYHQSFPIDSLSHLIKSMWTVESEGVVQVSEEKIVPDGYPEVIFHYGDPYEINMNGSWELQEKFLLAGQLSKFIRLRNTGKVGMFAIKFQPWALSILYGLKQNELTDKVIALPLILQHEFASIKSILVSNQSFEVKKNAVENHFLNSNHKHVSRNSIAERAIKAIIQSKGLLSTGDLSKKLDIGERTLQRHFKSHIGTSAKFYTRIIRLANIFDLIKNNTNNWSQLTYLSGFYDQSHFIKNFQEFTGDKPSAYGFDVKNMANLFLS